MDMRQQILDATERVIQSRGLARVTTREIAREAGCAEGTLYRHFADKEALFLAVIQQHLPDFVTTVQEELAGTRTVAENLQSMIGATISYYEKLMPFTFALFAASPLLDRHPQWMGEQNTGPMKVYERVMVYLEAEQRLGRISEQSEPLHIASLLLGACFQYAFILHFQGQEAFPQPRTQFINGIVQTLLMGIQKRQYTEKTQ